MYNIFIPFAYNLIYDFDNQYFAAQEEMGDDVTDGILRKANLPVVPNSQCRKYLNRKPENYEANSGFLCAGGFGEEESCYVRTIKRRIRAQVESFNQILFQ